jgi:hypothetical protein
MLVGVTAAGHRPICQYPRQSEPWAPGQSLPTGPQTSHPIWCTVPHDGPGGGDLHRGQSVEWVVLPVRLTVQLVQPPSGDAQVQFSVVGPTTALCLPLSVNTTRTLSRILARLAATGEGATI